MVAVAALCLNVGCTSKAGGKEKTGRVTYTVTSPLLTDTTVTKKYVAQIQSVRNVEIRAQEKGYLQDVFVDEGEYVKAGQLLFRIMPKIYEAEYLKAQAAVKEVELELLNTKTLAEKNIVSKTEQQIGEAKLQEAKAEQALAKLHLSLTEIRAPFDGTIDRIRNKLGSLIDEGALLTTISDNQSVFAYFNVPEAEYLDLKAHATDVKSMGDVDLILANGDRLSRRGKIETIESEFDNETGNIAFRAKFPNPDALLRHGETGEVQMAVPVKAAVIIPQKATYELQDKVYVFAVDKNKVVKSKQVTIKNRLPDIYIVEGVSPEDKIVLEGVQNIKDDDQIDYHYQDPHEVMQHLSLIKP
jgi:membrane fusion protein (multidrug efflux system)